MAKINIEHCKDYTVLHNEIFRNKNLSLKARGLLATMLSLPDDWDFSTQGLVAILKEGESAIRSTLKELESEKYLVRNRVRNPEGKFSDVEYTLYEKPYMEKPYVENQRVENRVQLNTKELNTKELNTINISMSDLEEIKDAWNCLIEHDISSIAFIKSGTERYKSLKARVKEYGKENVLEAIENIKTSSFLCGKSNSKWKITFDWFIKPNNFPKVLEGKYNDKDEQELATSGLEEMTPEEMLKAFIEKENEKYAKKDG